MAEGDPERERIVQGVNKRSIPGLVMQVPVIAVVVWFLFNVDRFQAEIDDVLWPIAGGALAIALFELWIMYWVFGDWFKYKAKIGKP